MTRVTYEMVVLYICLSAHTYLLLVYYIEKLVGAWILVNAVRVIWKYTTSIIYDVIPNPDSSTSNGKQYYVLRQNIILKYQKTRQLLHRRTLGKLRYTEITKPTQFESMTILTSACILKGTRTCHIYQSI